MNIILNLRKIRWGWLLVIIVLFVTMFWISTLLGDDARNACLWAIVVNGLAAFGGIVPVVYAVLFRPSVPIYYVLATSVIRLLLAIAGSGAVLAFVKIDIFWFAAAMGILYAAILVSEACFIAVTVRDGSEVDKA